MATETLTKGSTYLVLAYSFRDLVIVTMVGGMEASRQSWCWGSSCTSDQQAARTLDLECDF